jgi:hypothetical protein
LRTTFHSMDGQPVQKSLLRPASLRCIDVSAEEPAERNRRAAQIVERDASEPYDFGPAHCTAPA